MYFFFTDKIGSILSLPIFLPGTERQKTESMRGKKSVSKRCGATYLQEMLLY